MIETISRDEIKRKLDRGDDFYLVETLGEEKYRHTHLPMSKRGGICDR